MLPKHAEDRAKRIQSFRRCPDHLGRPLSSLKGLAEVAQEDETFRPQSMGDGITGKERSRPIGADHRGTQTLPLQRGFRQQSPGPPVFRRGGEHLRAETFGRSHIAAGERTSRCIYCGAGITIRGGAIQVRAPN